MQITAAPTSAIELRAQRWREAEKKVIAAKRHLREAMHELDMAGQALGEATDHKARQFAAPP